MAKAILELPEGEVEQMAAAPAETVSLEEFCSRLSETITKPELIGGFAYSQRVAGKLRDTADNYSASYTDFINKPV